MNESASASFFDGRFISVGEASLVSGKSEKSIYRWIARGELGEFRGFDGTIRVDGKELFRVIGVKKLGRPRHAKRV